MVITPDNRGVGRTTPQEIETSINLIADDCVALARHLNLPSINILGHSMGGFVALDIATRYPNSLDKLVLACTCDSSSKRNNSLLLTLASLLETEGNSDIWYRNLFYWLFSERIFEDDIFVETMVQYAMNYPYPQSSEAFKNQVKAITKFNCSATLPTITAETLVISGGNDILFPSQKGVHWFNSIPKVTHTKLNDAAHSIHLEQPENFTSYVVDFLLFNQQMN